MEPSPYGTLLLLILLSLAPLPQARAGTGSDRPYSVLIREAGVKAGGDEVDAVVDIVGAGRLTAPEVAARIKGEIPEIDPRATVRVLDEVLANVVTEGDDHRRLRTVLEPLLKFMGLEGRVRAVLFRSEVPFVALSPPNGLMISTRAMALLSDEELRALVAHELCHLAVTGVFRAAVDAKDYRTLRLVELFCDAGSAAITMARGEDPRSLIAGLRRMQRVLEMEFGEGRLKGEHPTLDERARLSREVCCRLRT
jgi:hypothetical protein